VAESIRFDHRMSDADTLMWHVEQDPLLRSTITVVWRLDRPPNRERLDDKIERATRTIPRLRQRVAANPLSIATPRWEFDPNFDRSFHCRFLKVVRDRSWRAVLDMAQVIAMQAFDRARPLWEFYVLDDLANGGAAMVMKLHHSISDGVGLVQMTSSLVETYREPDPNRSPKPMPPEPEVRPMTRRERVWDALAYEGSQRLGRARRMVEAVGQGLGDAVLSPVGTVRRLGAGVASTARLLAPVAAPLSPIMGGRSLSVHFDTISLSLPALKAAAKLVGGTLNDAFVAGVAGGLRRYHERHGAPVDTLRMTMPINVRGEGDGNRAGNRFVPARLLVPVGIADARERILAIHELVRAQRSEPALGLLDDVSSVLRRLPAPVYTVLFGSMLKGVDFVTSNVPGPPMEVFVSGARIEGVFGFGPLSGAAANLTLFSYLDHLGLAVNTDRAAVPDPDVFVECLKGGFAEVLRLASAPPPAS
jgi:WS/DGAT/MGAT family acyltransferase